MPHSDPVERRRIATAAVAVREELKRKRAARGKRVASQPEELSSIADYDRLLGQPQNWGDAKRREEVMGEITSNERRRIDLEKARDDAALSRGRLFSREQVLARDEKRDAAILDHLQEITEAMVKLIPLERQADGRIRSQEVLIAFRSATAARLRSIS